MPIEIKIATFLDPDRGDAYFAATTEEGCLKQIADQCRAKWDDFFQVDPARPGWFPTSHLSDSSIIEIYFAEQEKRRERTGAGVDEHIIDTVEMKTQAEPIITTNHARVMDLTGKGLAVVSSVHIAVCHGDAEDFQWAASSRELLMRDVARFIQGRSEVAHLIAEGHADEDIVAFYEEDGEFELYVDEIPLITEGFLLDALPSPADQDQPAADPAQPTP